MGPCFICVSNIETISQERAACLVTVPGALKSWGPNTPPLGCDHRDYLFDVRCLLCGENAYSCV